MNDFNDIAAYQDKMVPRFIRRILNSPRFQAFMARFPVLPSVLQTPGASAVTDTLKQIQTVSDFQKLMSFLLQENIKATTDSFTWEGMENLPEGRGVILLSNHRSIGLDAAYTNYCLYREGRPTVYNGCGDNIMKTSWLGHLIRINKGFVVKRTISDLESKLNEISRLSSYINHLLSEEKSVWIAHRGGRAKNGIDATDSVVLAMLFKESGYEDWSQWSAERILIPLSISWEIHPCDLVLANEGAQAHYRKPVHRDFSDILSEIASPKGRVHISFGQRIQGRRRKELTEQLDRAIQTGFRLWDANWLAYSMSSDCSSADADWIREHIDVERGHWVLDRSSILDNESKSVFLDMYANPVRQAVLHAGSIREALKPAAPHSSE